MLLENIIKIAGNKIADPKIQNKMMLELNDLLTSGSGKGGRMMPMFDEVAEVAIDPKTGYAFKNGPDGSLKDVSPSYLFLNKLKFQILLQEKK